MSRRTPRLLAVACTAIVALVVVGCSGDDGDDGADTTTTAVATSSTASTDGATDDSSTTATTGADRPVDPAAEAAMTRATAANLTIDDFPSGWQNLPPTEAAVSVVELCTTVDLDAHLLALAHSDAFSYSIEPGTLQASTATAVFADEATAADLVADFRDDAFVRCATEQLGQGTDTYTVSGALSRNDSEPGLGDEAVALSGDFVITPTDGSPSHTLSAVVVAIRAGDTVVTLSTSAVDRAFDESVTRSLATTLDTRLAG